VGGKGLEKSTESPANSQISTEARTLSRTVDAGNPASDPPAGQPIDPDLAAIIDAWPTLPLSTRDKIMALARVAGE
jgi:hypothetical protein